jgi:predicted metal-binding membrane protein
MSPNLTLLEHIVRRERVALIATLALVSLACWAWIVPMARDMYGSMMGPSAWMMTNQWDASHLFLLVAMWIVMMAGMMLPSAAPLLLLYGAASRQRSGDSGGRGQVYAMSAGYLLVWVGFSVCAALLQRILTRALLLSSMMTATTPWLSGGLLIVAGVYQFTPLKRACLAMCSAPLDFLMRRWRDGRSGAFRLGVEHGLFCVGCCWALMLLLFAGGVMNLIVIAALAAVVLVEKLLPIGPRTVRITGVFLIVLAVWVLAHGRQG